MDDMMTLTWACGTVLLSSQHYLKLRFSTAENMATWHIFGSVSQHYIQDGALPSPWSHSCYKCVHSWHWKVFWIKASSKQQAIPHPQKRHMLGGYSRCIKATGSSAGANVRLNLKSNKAQLILFWDFVNFMLQSQTQQWPLVNTVLQL